ncbi:MAG: tRNA 5-methoxyuridine(34)/uridine 5-oxyacetic acid(34) synthase CmoB [Actinobacteria bacterium]|nr:tRNA 5-methoxyuridine(34)/uridine 5-oxyacetic acid(34) synthase CmoB [Actinomycetota bacterium]
MPTTGSVTELIPETSLAEQLVADALAIDAAAEDAERVRDSVALWFHTFALAPGIYTPGIARDHGYRLGVLGEDRFAGRSVLDVGAFDGFYSFLAERRGARRVVAVDNEQYVDWVPGGEIVLETYGSRLAADTPAIEVREPGDVYARDEFTYWGFPAEGLRRLGRIVGLDDVEIVDEVQVDGHPRIVAVLRSAS